MPSSPTESGYPPFFSVFAQARRVSRLLHSLEENRCCGRPLYADSNLCHFALVANRRVDDARNVKELAPNPRRARLTGHAINVEHDDR